MKYNIEEGPFVQKRQLVAAECVRAHTCAHTRVCIQEPRKQMKMMLRQTNQKSSLGLFPMYGSAACPAPLTSGSALPSLEARLHPLM